jgi:hypothetical protein
MMSCIPLVYLPRDESTSSERTVFEHLRDVQSPELVGLPRAVFIILEPFLLSEKADNHNE